MLSTADVCVQAVKMLARLHHHLGSPERSSQVLEQQVRDFPEATDLTHINILAELFMDAGRHGQASSLIRQAQQLPCMRDGVPIDLRVSTLEVSQMFLDYVIMESVRLDDRALPEPFSIQRCKAVCMHPTPYSPRCKRLVSWLDRQSNGEAENMMPNVHMAPAVGEGRHVRSTPAGHGCCNRALPCAARSGRCRLC